MTAAVVALAGCTRSSGPPAESGAVGAVAWTWNAPGAASVGMPVADEQYVAVTHGRRALVLLDGTGRRQWEAERIGLREVAPLLTADLVVAATEEGLVGFDRATGSVRWDTAWGERANTPVAADGRAVATSWEGAITAVDFTTGRVAWRTSLPGGALGPAAHGGSGGTVVATWENDHGSAAGVVAFDARSGERRWERSLQGGGVSGPAVTSSGIAVLVAGDLAVHGLDVASGEERWRTDVEGAGSPEVPPLALADGTVVVGHRLGGLVQLDAATGTERWAASSDGAAVRGGPAGPGPGDPRFALPLDDGRVLVAGPGGRRLLEIASPASGVAAGPGGTLMVATGGGAANSLTAWRRW